MHLQSPVWWQRVRGIPGRRFLCTPQYEPAGDTPYSPLR
jgi:hypothetical protein